MRPLHVDAKPFHHRGVRFQSDDGCIKPSRTQLRNDLTGTRPMIENPVERCNIHARNQFIRERPDKRKYVDLIRTWPIGHPPNIPVERRPCLASILRRQSVAN